MTTQPTTETAPPVPPAPRRQPTSTRRIAGLPAGVVAAAAVAGVSVYAVRHADTATAGVQQPGAGPQGGQPPMGGRGPMGG